MNGQALALWRTGKGWTARELARQLGVNVSSVSRWERDKWPVPRYIELAVETLSREPVDSSEQLRES